MTVGNKASFDQLLHGLQQTNPRLYDALKLLAADVHRLNLEVFPPLPYVPPTPPVALAPPVLASFNYTLHPDNVFLFWSLESGNALGYELRKGPVFEAADIILRTDTSGAFVPPLLVGTHRYWLQAIGTESRSVPLFVDVIISPLGGFVVTVAVIDNNVLLTWHEPTSVFRISHYIIRRENVIIGKVSGTFTVIFEQASGTYNYSITGYDIAGNPSLQSDVSATVLQPPDYELQEQYVSDLTHYKENVLLIDALPSHLLCCVRDETWEEHFMDREWNNIQDQIDDGFPIYIQPTNINGTYEEIHDVGVLLESTVVNINFNTTVIYPLGHDVVVLLSYSADQVTWTDPVPTLNLFAMNLRYLKVTVEFTVVD